MADKIVAEYIVKTDKAVAELNKVLGRLDSIEKEQKKTQDGFKSMSKGMAADFKKVGAAIGLAFGADQLISFGKEAVKVAAQAEGIRTAFARLNRPDLLSELRKATRGAVDDITLMRQAIRAQNFKVPLEQLGKFFDFATQRSIQTGESVDYLVNSIIDGIGRKSTLVLDNLGISATELQEEMKKTGDFGAAAGNIISRELEKAGDVADTTAIRLGRINTAFENLKAVIGREIITEARNLEKAFEGLNQEVKELFGETNTIELFADALSLVFQYGTSGAKALAFLAKGVLNIVGNVKEGILEIGRNLGLVEDELEETAKRGEGLAGVLAGVFDLINSQGGGVAAVITISKLNEELKDLKKRFNDAEIGGSEWNQLVIDISKKTSELEAATTKATAKLVMFQQAARGFDPFAVDEFDDKSAEGIGLDFKSVDEETEAIGDALNQQVFIREDGSERIQQIIDDQLREALEANDKELESAKKLEEEKKRLRDQAQQEQRDYFDATLQAWQTITSTASMLVDAQYQQQLAALNNQLEKEQITREEYDKRKSSLAKEQFKKQKEFALVQASINTALGVTNAIATAPNIVVGLILAAVAAAAGAAEIATIASQPTPQFAEGGFVNEHGEIIGRSHAQGGVLIEAEGNEFITKGKYAQQNADILKAINSGDWEKYKMENIIAPAINQVLEGGFEGMGASYMLNTNWTDRNLLKQGDRNRYAMRDGFVYLGDRLENALKSKSRSRYA